MNSFVIQEDGSSAWAQYSNAGPAAGSNKPVPKASANAAPPKAAASASGGQDSAALEKLILGSVNDHGLITDTADFMAQHNISSEELDPVLKSLVSLDYLVLDVIESKRIELTEEGKSYAVNGSLEFQFVAKI